MYTYVRVPAIFFILILAGRAFSLLQDFPSVPHSYSNVRKMNMFFHPLSQLRNLSLEKDSSVRKAWNNGSNLEKKKKLICSFQDC